MFQLELSNRFEALQPELEPSADVESIWEKLNTTYREAAEEKLGYKKKKKERWISERTWKLIDSGKSAKVSILSASDVSELIVL